jgi:hypothetical protein
MCDILHQEKDFDQRSAKIRMEASDVLWLAGRLGDPGLLS